MWHDLNISLKKLVYTNNYSLLDMTPQNSTYQNQTSKATHTAQHESITSPKIIYMNNNKELFIKILNR